MSCLGCWRWQWRTLFHHSRHPCDKKVGFFIKFGFRYVGIHLLLSGCFLFLLL